MRRQQNAENRAVGGNGAAGSLFFQFLREVLTLGARGVSKSRLPRFLGFIIYAALCALVILSAIFNLGTTVLVSVIVLLILVSIMSVVLLIDPKVIRQWVFEFLVVIIVLSFLAITGYAVVKLLGLAAPPSPMKQMPKSEVKPDQPAYSDPVKAACMGGSFVDCENYAGRILVKCNPFDTACKLLANCWQDKARALRVVDDACNVRKNAESCAFQKANLRAQLTMDCDKKTLGDF
jgi:hypothetical protein